MTTTRLNVLLFSILLTASCSKSRTAAPVKPQLEKVSFRKVLILGNSITRHPKVPAIGWNAEWGMAASSPDKDYVHLLEANFKKSDASTKVTAVNISAFEHNFWQYNLSDLDSLKRTEPDLIILRIGENVQDSLVVKRDLKKHINSLIDYFAAKNADVKVVIAGSFWKKDQVDATFKEVADYSGYAYLSLSFLSGDLSNTAYNRFTDLGIGSHPGDKGMSEIAGLIWSKIVEFSKK